MDNVNLKNIKVKEKVYMKLTIIKFLKSFSSLLAGWFIIDAIFQILDKNISSKTFLNDIILIGIFLILYIILKIIYEKQ